MSEQLTTLTRAWQYTYVRDRNPLSAIVIGPRQSRMKCRYCSFVSRGELYVQNR